MLAHHQITTNTTRIGRPIWFEYVHIGWFHCYRKRVPVVCTLSLRTPVLHKHCGNAVHVMAEYSDQSPFGVVYCPFWIAILACIVDRGSKHNRKKHLTAVLYRGIPWSTQQQAGLRNDPTPAQKAAFNQRWRPFSSFTCVAQALRLSASLVIHKIHSTESYTSAMERRFSLLNSACTSFDVLEETLYEHDFNVVVYT